MTKLTEKQQHEKAWLIVRELHGLNLRQARQILKDAETIIENSHLVDVTSQEFEEYTEDCEHGKTPISS